MIREVCRLFVRRSADSLCFPLTAKVKEEAKQVAALRRELATHEKDISKQNKEIEKMVTRCSSLSALALRD